LNLFFVYQDTVVVVDMVAAVGVAMVINRKDTVVVGMAVAAVRNNCLLSKSYINCLADRLQI